MSKRFGITLAVAVSAATVCYAFGGFASWPRSFDEKLWKEGNADLRGSMVRDLLDVPRYRGRDAIGEIVLSERSVLFQASRDQIKAILGPLDDEDDFTNFMSYDLGYMGRRGYFVPPRALMIHFDDTGMPDRIGVTR